MGYHAAYISARGLLKYADDYGGSLDYLERNRAAIYADERDALAVAARLAASALGREVVAGKDYSTIPAR